MTHSQARSTPSSASATSTALPPLHVARSETKEDDRAALRERYRLGHVPDDALHEGVKNLVGRHNVLTADLLAHLAEVEVRGIYRERACSSLYTYCVYELRFSEDEAQRRSQAARTARRFPMLFDMLAEGAIHMTGLLLLAPHLTAENCTELLARARFRTKREIERLVAEIAPRADVPSRIEPLGPGSKTVANLWQAYTASLRGRVRDLELGTGRGEAPAPVFDMSEQVATSELNEELPASALAETPASTRKETSLAVDSKPVVPLRYRIEFTVGQDHVDRLEEARNLLQHQVPDRDIARIHELAMSLFVEHLRKRRRATRNPRRRVESERIKPAEGESERSGADESAPERTTEPSHGNESAPERISELLPFVLEPTSESPPLGQPARPQTSEPLPSQRTAPERMNASEQSAPERMNQPSACERSAPERMTTTSRYIPASIRRVVWARDGGCWTCSDANGRRCRERSGLEIHHEQPFALGGATTVENLRLLCRAHNALFAERDFGRALVERMRNGGRRS